MAKKLTFSQWRKNVLGLGWFVLIGGIITLFISLFDPTIEKSYIFLPLFLIGSGVYLLMERRKA